MKIIYDPKYNIVYIQLREKIKDVETLNRPATLVQCLP